MRGFIRRRGDAWELRAYLGCDPVTGRKRYASRTFRGTRRDAERALGRLVGDADDGRLARTSVTVRELLEEWFELAAIDYSPKTVRETRGYLDRNLLPALGAIPLSRLRPVDLDRYYRSLLTSGTRGRPLAPGTIRRIHGILRRALQQGVKWGWLGVNPAAAASPPRVPLKDIRPPSPADLGRLLSMARAEDPDLATFLAVSGATGARRSEVVALRWTDIDVELGTVTIERGVVFGPDGLVVKDTKTHQSRRLALDPATLDALIEHRRTVEARAATGEVEVPADAFVFGADPVGSTPWFPDSVTRRFRRLADAADLRHVRLHDLRHYVATRLLAAGVDVRTVAGRLGHRNASTTLNVYSHFLPEADREAATILAGLLTG